ncbi:MAG: DNA translocase FtsK 4TM domain-containing protein, partial [Bacteriovoracaceae bacterium]
MEDFPLPQQEIPQPPVRKKKSDNGSKKKPQQRRQVLSFLVIVFGVMALLSMVSYSPADETNGDIRFSDLYKVFTNDPLIQQKSELTTNWLGLFGAILSNFLINSTVGLFAFIVPVLLLMWGWTMLRKGDIRRLVYFTNYSIILALLGAAFFGLLRKTGLGEVISPEWHGSIGSFFATILQQSIGLAGGMIITLSLAIVAITLAIDLDLHKTSERIKETVVAIGSMFGAKMEEWKVQQEVRSQQREEEKKRAAAEIKVKRPDDELPQRDSKTEPRVMQPKKESAKPEPIITKRIDEELPSAIDASDIPLEINEGVTEKEAELEEREVEDEEIDYVFPSVDLLDPKKYEEKIS